MDTALHDMGNLGHMLQMHLPRGCVEGGFTPSITQVAACMHVCVCVCVQVHHPIHHHLCLRVCVCVCGFITLFNISVRVCMCVCRSTAFIIPTVNCLVELTEHPFTVIALNEIEIVNLERVGFNLKNFDMAIIFKDFHKDVRGSAMRGGEGGRSDQYLKSVPACSWGACVGGGHGFMNF